jgi:hypothetical protein
VLDRESKVILISGGLFKGRPVIQLVILFQFVSLSITERTEQYLLPLSRPRTFRFSQSASLCARDKGPGETRGLYQGTVGSDKLKETH